MDDPRSELESMLSYSIDAELPFSLERKYVLHHVLAFWSPSPLGPDQILATAIAVTESRSGRPDPHSGNHHRRDCYRHAAIVRGRGINTRHREAFFELRMYSTQQISAALSMRGTAGMFWYN